MDEGDPPDAQLPKRGASSRTRTGMPEAARDFKSLVSTYSTKEALLARPAGLEPATYGLEDRCSNPTELRADLVGHDRLELSTYGL